MPPATAPPREPQDLVLHIGTGKTATSSLQLFLHRNRNRLAELGHLYPKTPGRTRHIRLGLFIRADDDLENMVSWQRESFSSPEEFRKAFRRRLFREINRAGLSRILFSDEALYGCPNLALRRLSRFAGRIAGSLRVVVYLRRQDDHLVSRYQQLVKIGETRRLADRTRRLNLSQTYDYYARLRTWQRLLKPDELVVRPFERDRFANGSLYQDFLDAVGIDARAEDMDQVRTMNESLDAESVEFLRILNVLRVENEAVRTLVSVDRPLVKRLAAASTGPTLTLPGPFLDEFMAHWEESNLGVARDLMNERDGLLFHTPRKARNTTSEQFLDPARLDHYLTLLQLPDQVHGPLRTLVEREAKAR